MNLLKDLCREEDAYKIIQLYMEQHDKNRDVFNLAKYAFGPEVTDPAVREKFNEKYRSFEDDRPPVEVLLGIVGGNGWSSEDITFLSKLSADDFYTIFTSNHGPNLTRIVRAATDYKRIVNADENMKKIVTEAKEVLMRIGRQSSLNRQRVRKFGVVVDD